MAKVSRQSHGNDSAAAEKKHSRTRRVVRGDGDKMPAVIDDEDASAEAFWLIVFALPLACPEAMYPGICEILAEGYAIDLEDDSGIAYEAWKDVKTGIGLAQVAYHAARTKWLRRQELAAAATLHAKLLSKLSVDVSSNALAAIATSPSLQLAMQQVWLFLDLSYTWCVALEALASNPPAGMVPIDALASWKEDLGEKAMADIAEIFQQCKVPTDTRLMPLWPEQLPKEFAENCRMRLGNLRQRHGVEGSRRRFRLICQSTSWMSRRQVDRLLAELESREFSLPQQPKPKYWSSESTLPVFSLQLVSLGNDSVEQFQAVFDKSWRSAITKDRKTRLAERFLVEGVVKIENQRAWSEYSLRRDDITLERWGAGAVPEIEDVKVDRALLPGQVIDEGAGSRSEVFVKTLAGAQELFLFHGTSLAGALNIAENDFSTEFSSTHGLYGPGLYFGESVSKSDEYCEVQDQLCTMLVCRVCMGNHLVVEDPKGSKHMDSIIKDLDGSDKHSILGDREKVSGTYREFIVYDSSAAYAEYIVTYRRTFGADAQSARCASVANTSDSASALGTALAAARQRQSELSAAGGLSSLLASASITDSPWSYIGGEWAEPLPVEFVDNSSLTAAAPGTADSDGTAAAASVMVEGEGFVCEACGKDCGTENKDALGRHLAAYADNDSSGDHRRALEAFNAQHGITEDQEISENPSCCCTVM